MLPSRPSVILIAHGSRLSDDAHEAAVRHALTLRQSNRYGFVDVCFLATQKNLPNLPKGEIFLLPFFMSNGYFVAKCIPELFGLENGRRIELDRHIYQCEALGTDPELADIIVTMGEEVCRDQSDDPKHVHLVLVAHGSEKSRASSEATYLQRKAVESKKKFAAVSVAFLNERPYLEDWLLEQPDDGLPLVLVGLFAADGPHAAEDVPSGISNWRAKSSSPVNAHYAGAVGVRPEIVRLIQHSISRCASAGFAGGT
ncbi:MAG: hypothetical protein K9G33_02815 [Sneathiella sp.]|nr:hypothetical protein [Sneathiella sp.]